MSELFDELDRIRRTEKRAALATLVATRGTSPRKEGARMWVGEGGGILGSVTIGGCVDAEVVRASDDVLTQALPRLLAIELGDEEAHALGLTCAGAIDVLVQPLDLANAGENTLLAAYDSVREHTRRGGRAVVVTLLPAPGAVAAGPLVVFDNGTTGGTLGNARLDAEARTQATERMQKGGSRTLPLRAGGPAVDAFFEVHGRGPLLLVVGAGAITQPLVGMAKLLGMYVVVVEGRDRFADPTRLPEADEVRGGMPSDEVANLDYDATSAIVLVAHDYKYDLPVLKVALQTGAGYVGMLGSRRRAGTILDMLAQEGVGPEALARIRTPIGLDIGGQTAGEIALSILAELVAVRNGRNGGPMRDRRQAEGPAAKPAT
jgi:xanthine dehydrogenase accessory factor